MPTETPTSPVLRVTRWVAAAVIFFLVDAAQLLLLLPDRTTELFAWPIAPQASAMVLGSAYVAGGYYFVRVVFVDSWHRVAAGLPPVIVFVWLAALATALHSDRFTPGLPFAAWAAIYAVAPIGLPLLLLAQRRAATPRDAALPRSVRIVLGAAGGAVTAAALVAFAFPGLTIGLWPWLLSPLTARIVAAVAALFGSVWVSVAVDGGRTAARIPLQAHIIGLACLLLAAVRGGGDIDWTNPLAVALVAGVAAMALADLALTQLPSAAWAAVRPASSPARIVAMSRSSRLGTGEPGAGRIERIDGSRLASPS
jgi:hypothetical protein